MQHAVDKTLAAKAGIDRHQQHHVDLVHHIFQAVQRGRRIEDQPGSATAIADVLESAVDVVAGFRVKGDVRRAGGGKIGDDPIHRLDHQVRVNRRGHAVFAQRLAHQRTDGQIGDIMVVHHIEMHPVRARRQHRVHFRAQPSEVGG
jgi:hypothetical protein